MSFTGTIVPCCALILTTLCLTTQAQPNIVISQIYGGGGNTGATLRNDFVELFNRGNAPVSVTGWTVQYASASGATWIGRLSRALFKPVSIIFCISHKEPEDLRGFHLPMRPVA